MGRYTNDPGDEQPEVTLVGQKRQSGTTSSGDESGDRLSVLIISDKLVTTRPLPASGEVRIGRAPGSDLVIDDPSISRSHALLTIGPPLALSDLGSANGTRVRDRMLGSGETIEIAPGDVILLGNATLIVQRRAPPVRAQRIWAHDYFEVRLEEECARGQRDGGAFAVARLHVSPAPQPQVLQEVLASESRSSDVVGEYGPEEIELLLLDTPPDAAAAAIDRVAQNLRRRRMVVQTGLACFPRDGLSAHELVHRASPFPRHKEPTADAAVSAAIVADRRMQDLYRLAERIAAGNITVLILGETGVGKEILAERVHRMSPRSARPYLKLNCAALSETLLESELFGHERGAFTGAMQAKQGLLETADGGTVFLDEVGELPHSIQVKLLRVIEERMVLRVGGLKPRPLDVRFIAATNRDLENEISRGTFRQDLFFRLNGATLVIPPLRERTSEIHDLARAFAAQAARQMGLPSQPALSSEALELMMSYSWPGNIRELRNVVERAVLLCGRGPVLPAHLPLEKMRATIAVRQPTAPPVPIHGPAAMNAMFGPSVVVGPSGAPTLPPPINPAAGARRGPPLVAPPETPLIGDQTMPIVVGDLLRATHGRSPLAGHPPAPIQPAGWDIDDEKARILEALNACAGNQTAAARMLGIARRTLINKLELYGISGPRKKR
ncbi:MAG TPA: sigma 54-interacting transcriptional regulator [Kofleriaceae bacterium]|nr:sigma 54-interacting transcriptional regulator [Kofleriaceae bacterium]